MGPQLGPPRHNLGGQAGHIRTRAVTHNRKCHGTEEPSHSGLALSNGSLPSPLQAPGLGGGSDNNGVLLLAPELEPTTVCCVCPLSVSGPLLNFPHAAHCVLGCFPLVDSESPLSESLDKLTKTFSSNTSRLGCNFWDRNRTIHKWFRNGLSLSPVSLPSSLSFGMLCPLHGSPSQVVPVPCCPGL